MVCAIPRATHQRRLMKISSHKCSDVASVIYCSRVVRLVTVVVLRGDKDELLVAD